MCIIVAKKAGIKMPTMETLQNCFDNNPDGAGFMLADGKAVYGFKGLMSFDEFKSELKKATKRFGCLDKLPVVMHFRISTHGSVIGGNTHPFPLKGGYREMRKTEWIADQGFAHNGIIHQTSHDKDIKKFNVSDTMVFAKKYINPVAKYANIASDTALLDMFFELADSKLCFLTKKGKLATRGHFVEKDGVFYSNTSFEEDRYTRALSRGWGYYSYDWNDLKYSKDTKQQFRISDFDMQEFIDQTAEDYGYYAIPEGSMIYFCDGTCFCCEKDSDLYFDDGGWIYRFNREVYDFDLFACAEEYDEIKFALEEV